MIRAIRGNNTFGEISGICVMESKENMNRTEELFFYVLGAVVQKTSLEAQYFNDVTPEEWTELFRLSKMQGVTAVVFEKLSAAFDECEDFPRPPKALTLNWYAQSQSIERKMAIIHKRSEEFAELMAERGLHTLVLKGIAVSTYYPNPLHREFGDLDCYLFEGNPENTIIWENCYEKGNVAGEAAGCVVKRGHYKHSHIKYNGLEIENHQFALPIKDGKETKELERHLREVALPTHKNENNALLIPSTNFNALFLTAHAMSHFLYESIKIRNVLDWALFLKKEQNNVDWKTFWEWCEKMHYTRFVECLNFICEKHLGVEIASHVATSFGRPKTYNRVDMSERILRDVFSGNSIYTHGYGYIRFRIALAMSYFKSMWKFQQVYQHNALWLLMKRAWGMTIKDIDVKL